MRLATILALFLVLTTAAAAGGQIATSQGLTGGQDWRPAAVAARLADRFQPGDEVPAGADCRPVCTATATAIRNPDAAATASDDSDPNASSADSGSDGGNSGATGDAHGASGDPGAPAGNGPGGNAAEGGDPAADALVAGGPGFGSGDPSATGASSATGDGNGNANGNANGSANGGSASGNPNGNGSATGNGGANGSAGGNSSNATGNNNGNNGKATGRPDHAGGPDDRTAPPPGLGGTPPGELRAAEAQSLIAALNAERRDAGLPPLKSRGNLAAVAGGHSGDMAGQQALSHTSSDGRGLADRLQAGGVSYATAGENVAAIAAGGDAAGTIVEAFMASALHRANILSEAFDEVGVAVFQDESGRLWITVVFAG